MQKLRQEKAECEEAISETKQKARVLERWGAKKRFNAVEDLRKKC